MRFIRKNSNARKKRTGAAAVELAVTAPILVTLLLGMAEVGSILFTRHTMVLAAREGARQMSVEGASVQEAKDVVESYLTNAGIGNANITVQNAYKGNGDSASARQVNVHVEISPADASITGDMLNLYPSGSLITAEVSMRKEGELTSAPTSS
jgi:Flp pilus assembly protein TadG